MCVCVYDTKMRTHIIKSKLHPNTRIDARLQISNANMVAPSAGFEPLLFSDIYGNTACTKSNALDHYELSRTTIHRVLSYSPRLILGGMTRPEKAIFLYSLAGRVV